MSKTLSSLIGPTHIFLIMIRIVRTMIARKYMLLSLFSSVSQPGSVPSLKPIQKNRQEELKFTFDISKCDRIFDELLKTVTSDCHMLFHLPTSSSDMHIISGITLYLMLLLIVMFFVDRYNRPLMKEDWYFWDANWQGFFPSSYDGIEQSEGAYSARISRRS